VGTRDGILEAGFDELPFAGVFCFAEFTSDDLSSAEHTFADVSIFPKRRKRVQEKWCCGWRREGRQEVKKTHRPAFGFEIALRVSSV
jgi:hypothetical protein